MATSTLGRTFAEPVRNPPPRGLVWLARLVALSAAGIAVYLLWVSLAGGNRPAGCGDSPGVDCSSVLQSQWSTWAGLPVSLPAIVVYLALFAALFGIDADSERTERDAWRVLLPLATLAIGAASWFSFLQVVSLHNLCFYCLGVHACGLLLSLFIFWYAPVRRHAGGRHDPAAMSPLTAVGLVLVGLTGLGLLIAGQALAGPREADVQVVEVPPASPSDVVPGAPPAETGSAAAKLPDSEPSEAADPLEAQPAGESTSLIPGVLGANIPKHRRISLMGSKVAIDAYEQPILGDPEADAVLVELFDYTCPHCRELAPLMRQARERYGSQLAVIVLPMPMNKKCNRYVQVEQERHKEACEYARLALAAWYARPAEFEVLHEWLLDSATVPSVAAARAKAAELLGGQQALTAALANKAIHRQIDENGRIYHLAGHGPIPKLLGERMIVSGVPASDEKLYEVLEKQFNLHR